jgi:hypothetical protein
VRGFGCHVNNSLDWPDGNTGLPAVGGIAPGCLMGSPDIPGGLGLASSYCLPRTLSNGPPSRASPSCRDLNEPVSSIRLPSWENIISCSVNL